MFKLGYTLYKNVHKIKILLWLLLLLLLNTNIEQNENILSWSYIIYAIQFFGWNNTTVLKNIDTFSI